ncbi:MAG: hypothetical protein KGL44_03580 [Sphingomonadales bacterium]|nr:hypothetical protein [Sphingomonadales bacterium]
MNLAIEYREQANNQRRMADAAQLPMVRRQHLSAAERWEFLAHEAEYIEAGCLALFDSGTSQRVH